MLGFPTWALRSNSWNEHGDILAALTEDAGPPRASDLVHEGGEIGDVRKLDGDRFTRHGFLQPMDILIIAVAP
jgi:hypothetical protein